MADKKKPPRKRPSREPAGKKVEDLLVALLDNEKQDRAHRLATLLGELEALENRKKSVVADLTAEKKRLEAERSRLAGVVRDGKELRPVEVRMFKDFRKGTLEEIRHDTGETVRSRTLTKEDRQLELVPAAKTGGDHVTDKPPKGEEGRPLQGKAKTPNVVKLSDRKDPPEPEKR